MMHLSNQGYFCGCSSMVERELPKLLTWVRFPSPAPTKGVFMFRFNIGPGHVNALLQSIKAKHVFQELKDTKSLSETRYLRKDLENFGKSIDFKKQLLSCLLGMQNNLAQFKAIQIALDETTPLGMIFATQRYLTKPTISKGIMKQLHDRYTQLEREVELTEPSSYSEISSNSINSSPVSRSR